MTELPTTLEDLRTQAARGKRFRYLCFRGHDPKKGFRACLSQWYAAGFELEGEHFRTAEHWMMAGKARLFDDETAREKILRARHPADAKKLGRAVRHFDLERWQAACLELVVAGNVAKFQQNEDLGLFLAGTRGQILVEASPRDRVWGIGLGASNPAAEDPARWRGRNLLGFALMVARERLARG